jgi:hypothetical protein
MENFRQAGKEYAGKIYKGPMVDAFNRLTQSSIPTKSEQILSAVERKGGFGSSTDRFSTMEEPEVPPGPGQYKSSTAGESPSLSRKGYGGLISKSPRFKRFQYNTPVPGPGSYTYSDLSTQGVSSVFQKPIGRLPKQDEMPAPGSYDVSQNASNVTVSSPFKSKSKRYREYASTSPPPWQYNIQTAFLTSDKPSAAFKMPVRARRYPINLYDPHAPVPNEITPGPADYQSSFLPPINQKGSSQFMKSDIDRFGAPVKEKKTKDMTPGPGAYYLETIQEKVQVSGSVFMSESNRGIIKEPLKQPGPAFYRPVPVPKKKSFHLNANKVWI